MKLKFEFDTDTWEKMGNAIRNISMIGDLLSNGAEDESLSWSTQMTIGTNLFLWAKIIEDTLEEGEAGKKEEAE